MENHKVAIRCERFIRRYQIREQKVAKGLPEGTKGVVRESQMGRQ